MTRFKLVMLSVFMAFSSFSQEGFIENKGQIADFDGELHPEVIYQYQTAGLNLLFKKEGLSYYFYKNEEVEMLSTKKKSAVDIENDKHAPKPTRSFYYRLDMNFKNSNTANVEILASNDVNVPQNFYYPHCSDGILGVKTYEVIRYVNIYNNIDFVFKITDGGIKYDVVLKPGAKPSDIALLYDGVSEMEKISNTEVLIKTPIREFTESIPLSFYSENKEIVNCEFQLNENTLRFKVPNYNSNRELIIDPVQNWSSHFNYGSTNSNSGRPVFDKIGKMYNAGRVQTTGFPMINAGGGQYFDAVVSGTYEAIIYKFDLTNNIQWSTHYGTSGSDNVAWPGRALAMDSNQHLFVLLNVVGGGVGGGNCPTYDPGGGAFYQDQTKMYDFYNSAIVELDTNGVRQWATIISHESGNTNGQDFTVWGISAKDDKVYIAGIGSGGSANTIPLRSYPGGYYNPTTFGSVNPFIARFKNRALEWCTYVSAGAGSATYSGQGWDVEEDVNGSIWMAGNTSVGAASPGHLLTNPGGGAYYQSSSTGSYETILTKFGANLQPIWSTYYGGISLDDYESMTVNNKGEMFFVGYTHSADFPAVNPGGGAYFRPYSATSGDKNSYIVKIAANNTLAWSTTYSDSTILHGVGTDANNQLYAYGVAEGNASTVPTLNELGSYFDNTHNGGYFDYLLLKFDSVGVHQWGTFYGGDDYDGFGVSGRNGMNIFSDPCLGTKIMIFGQTGSLNFPTVDPGGALYQPVKTLAAGVLTPVLFQFTQAGASIIDTNTTDTSAICENQTKALTASIGGGTWTVFSGGGVIVGTTYTPANVAVNTSVTIRYTDICGTISDRTFTVNVYDLANNTTTTDSICETGTKALTGTPGGGTWSVVSGGGSIAGTTYTPTNIAVNTTVTIKYKIASNGACPADSSNVTFVVEPVFTPSITSSTADMCTGDKRLLTGTPTGGTFAVVSGPGLMLTNDTLEATGPGSIQISYTIMNACGSLDSIQNITVSNSIPVAITSSTASFCEDLTLVLTGTPAGGAWNIISGPGTESAGILTPTGGGTVRVEYAVTSLCGSGSDTVDIVINPLPNTDAGLDENICAGDSVTLTATGGGAYQWTPGPAVASQQVYPIVTTGYRVDITSDSGCVASDSVTVFVQIPGAAIAQDDQIIVTTGVQEIIDIYTNDIGAVGSIQILTGPFNGTGTLSGGNVTYVSTIGFVGNDSLFYQICDVNCQTVCDTALVLIQVDHDLLIPIGVSPNADGKNDVFNILGLNKYSDNSLSIFNRWGSLIFEAKPYLNDWDGQSIKTALGDEVVEGTYFYVLKLGEGLPSYNGYIELKK